MNPSRGIIISFAVLTLLAGCGRSEQPAADTAQAAPLTAWSDIAAENIFVPDGVLYTMVDVSGAPAAEIGGVPEDATATWRTGGVGVRVPDDFETQASGSRVRVTVRAAAQDAGAVLGVAYSTAEVGNSGWRQFPLTQTPTDYSFEYDVPAMNEGQGDFIGFRSYGDTRVQVLGYRTEVIAPGSAAQPPASPSAP